MSVQRLSAWNQITPTQSFPFVSGLRAIYDHSQIHKLSSTVESLQKKWEIIKYFYNSAWVWKYAHRYSPHKRVSFWRRSCQLAVPTRLIYNSLWLPQLHARFKVPAEGRILSETFHFVVRNNPSSVFWAEKHTGVWPWEGCLLHRHGTQRQESKPAGLQDPDGRRMVIVYCPLCFKTTLKAGSCTEIPSPLYWYGFKWDYCMWANWPNVQFQRSRYRRNDAQLNFQPERNNR